MFKICFWEVKFYFFLQIKRKKICPRIIFLSLSIFSLVCPLWAHHSFMTAEVSTRPREKFCYQSAVKLYLEINDLKKKNSRIFNFLIFINIFFEIIKITRRPRSQPDKSALVSYLEINDLILFFSIFWHFFFNFWK